MCETKRHIAHIKLHQPVYANCENVVLMIFLMGNIIKKEQNITHAQDTES